MSKKILSLALTLIIALGIFAVAAAAPAPAETAQPPGGDSGSIVGMWRSPRASNVRRPGAEVRGPTVGVYFFNADGTYAAIKYQVDKFLGEKGKYRLSGANLELSDISWFRWNDSSLSFSQYEISFFRKRWDLIGNGTRSELLEVIDPDHEIWRDYRNITGEGWKKGEDRIEKIWWIDATHFDFVTGLENPLELVP
ncbi:MAG: hypothetical protein FWG09_03545 [Synergistaceae bacterium]|nr:hypothetical protein [Synergistaceae bacterium]